MLIGDVYQACFLKATLELDSNFRSEIATLLAIIEILKYIFTQINACFIDVLGVKRH